VKQLKARAKRNGRSLQGEAKMVLEQAARQNAGDVAAIFARWDKYLAGKRFSSNAELIREDRER